MPRNDASFVLDSMHAPELNGTPFPWFDRESYPRVLAVMQDHDLMPPTYERWLRQARRVLEKARREGQNPIRAHINPEEFIMWCEANDWPADSVARLTFARLVAHRSLLRDIDGE